MIKLFNVIKVSLSLRMNIIFITIFIYKIKIIILVQLQDFHSRSELESKVTIKNLKNQCTIILFIMF